MLSTIKLNKFFPILISLLFISTTIHSYSYDFTNTMKGPVRVRIKMSGIEEPWYYATLNGKNELKGRNYEFQFRIGSLLSLGDDKWEYVGRKLGFCLSQIQVAPFERNKDTGAWEETDEWYDLAPFFVATNYYSKILQAAGQLADGLVDVAGKTVEMIEELMSAKYGGGKLKDISLKDIVLGVGELWSKSFCRSRSFTIVPNIDTKGQKAPGYILLINER